MLQSINDRDVALIGASCLSGLGSLVVILTFWRYRSLRRHPSQLIVSRSFVDLVFVVGLIMSRFSFSAIPALDNCSVLAFVSQFAGLAAEMYLLMLSVDLVLSITNPFTSYKTNSRRYHLIAIGVSLATAVLLVTLKNGDDHHVYGRDVLEVCWAGGSGERIDPYIFVLFTLPLLLIYIFSVGAVMFGSKRLRKGLPQSYEARMDVFKNSARYVVGYIAYWTFVGAIYIVMYTLKWQDIQLPKWVPFVLAIITGARGLVTLAVWLWTHDLHEAYLKAKLGEEVDGDEALAPHLNHALRSEILTYVTSGILKSLDYAESRPGRHDERNTGSRPFNLVILPRVAEVVQESMLSSLMTSTRSLKARKSSAKRSSSSTSRVSGRETKIAPQATSTSLSRPLLGSEEGPPAKMESFQIHVRDDSFDMGQSSLTRRQSQVAALADKTGFEFHDYDPHSFRRIRETFSISNDEYRKAFALGTAKEVFSGGGSGAFMFFSSDQRFIVKTMSPKECHVLLEIMPQYSRYLADNPHTLICKFFGCHSIRMYRRTIYVVVMDNVLHTDATIHERYDLKGSWINRQRRAIGRGETVRCRHCNQRYKVGDDDDSCPNRPNGLHRPNVILKDNDLNIKLHLDRTGASLLANQIDSDVAFLRGQRIMDYSLLLGVHRAKYRLMGGSSATSRPRLARFTSSSVGATLYTSAGAVHPPVRLESADSPASAGPLSDSSGRHSTTGSITPLQRAAARRELGHTAEGHSVDDSAAVLSGIQERRRSFLRREVSTGALSLTQVQAHTHGRGIGASIAASKTPRGRPRGGTGGRVPADAGPAMPGTRTRRGESATSVGSGDGDPVRGAGTASRASSTSSGLPPRASPRASPAASPGAGASPPLGRTLRTSARSSRAPVGLHVDLPPVRQSRSASSLRELLAHAMAEEAAMGGVGVMTEGVAVPEESEDLRPALGRSGSSRHIVSAELLETPRPRPTGTGGWGSAAASSAAAAGAGAGAGAGAASVQPFFKQHRGGLEAELVEGPGIYYMGIIDVLQRWDFWKRLEHFTKTRLLCRSSHGISAVHYDEYAERFYRRVAHEIIDNYDQYVPNSNHSKRARMRSTNPRGLTALQLAALQRGLHPGASV